MAAPTHGVSFYFFDFDDNIMFLSTPIFLLNTVTKVERAVSTGKFANIQPILGRAGPWEDYAIFDGSYRHFRDIPPDQLSTGQNRHFVTDVTAAVASGGDRWQGPSWKFFVYACEKQRSLSIVTARGHTRETLQAGALVLFEKRFIPREPLYHTLFPVGNQEVQLELGDTKLEMTIPALKRRAIIQTVEEAIKLHGSEPNLRFGMSDDDPQNVNLIIRAMCECKKSYPDRRFFVINTHMQEEVKLEVFPVELPAGGQPETAAPHLL
ncbi:MAG: hypothetical protein ACYDIC_17585 [Desulfobaccales bacterium]